MHVYAGHRLSFVTKVGHAPVVQNVPWLWSAADVECIAGACLVLADDFQEVQSSLLVEPLGMYSMLCSRY